MHSPREVRRAAKRLVAASRRVRAARALSASDYAFAQDVVRREAADARAAETPIAALADRADFPGAIAALSDEFATVLDVANADLATLVLVPGVDLAHARAIRAAARDARAEMISASSPRFTPDTPTAAQTALLRALRRRVLADRATGDLREPVVAVAKEARRLIPASRASAYTALRPILGPRAAKRSEDALARLRELITPHLDSDLAGQITRRLRTVPTLPVSGSGLWDDFREHPGEYYAVIEATKGAPRRVPRDYGPLAPDLVKRINATSLDLSLLRASLTPAQEFAARFAVFQGRVVLGDDPALDPELEVLAVMAHLAASGERHAIVLAPPGRQEHWVSAVRRQTALSPIPVPATRSANALTEWRAVGGVAIGTDDFLGAPGSFQPAILSLLVIDQAHHIADAHHAASRRIAQAIERADRAILLSDRATRGTADPALALARVVRPDLASSLADPGPDDPDELDALLAPIRLARVADTQEG